MAQWLRQVVHGSRGLTVELHINTIFFMCCKEQRLYELHINTYFFYVSRCHKDGMTYTVELHRNMTPKKDKNLLVCVVCRGHKDGMTYTVDLHINPVKKKKRKDKDLFVCVVCKCHKDGMTLLKIWVSVSAGSVGSETGGVARETNHLTHSQKQAHRG